MKLLLDENLSPRLAKLLAPSFPGTAHVANQGLRAHSDLEIWEHAADAGFVIVSKDSDFREISAALGPPPKVIWLRAGNAGTTRLHDILDAALSDIAEFVASEEDAVLVLQG